MKRILFAVAIIGLMACSPSDDELNRLKGTVVISCDAYESSFFSHAYYECLVMDSTGKLHIVNTGLHKLEPGTDFRQQKR